MRSFLRQGAAHLAPAAVFLEAEAEKIPSWSSVRASLLRLWANDHTSVVFPEGYKFMLREDLIPWIVFFTSFIILVVFDNVVLHRHEQKLTFNKACLFTLFWLATACLFCMYIWVSRGSEDAFDWATGYLLEWMLSVDNLFVFRSVFMVFKTPDSQKHKPLFWGIVGAVIFRMMFFVVEEFLVHTFSWMYILLGIFLIYTGVKVVLVDDEEANPQDNPVYNRIIKLLPYNDRYSPKARFCDWVPAVERERADSAGSTTSMEASKSTGGSTSPRGGFVSGTDDEGDGPNSKLRLVATRLTLVVICLEVTDIVFAVDSVSAIVAQIPDLFLAYTACVFAMLGLRATFFVVDELVSLFTLLPYAVGGILVLLGVKLVLRRWIHINPAIVCVILFSMIFLSIIGSIVYDRYQGKTGLEACCEAVADCGGGRVAEEEGAEEAAAGVHVPSKTVSGKSCLEPVPEEEGFSSLAMKLSALGDSPTKQEPSAAPAAAVSDDALPAKPAAASGGDV